MSTLVFLAAVASAFMNACWHATAKRQGTSSDALLGIVVCSAIGCSVAIPFVGPPPLSVWSWIGIGAACNVVFVRALMAAYDHTAFAIAYPIARGVIPPLMYVIGWSVFGESTSAAGLFGLILVVAGVVLFTFQARRLGLRDARGAAFAVLAGLGLTLSLAIDTKGVRLIGTTPGAIIQYGVWSSLVTAAALLTISQAEGKNPLAIMRRNGFSSVLGAGLLIASYLCGLWAYAQGPVSLVTPLRELAIVFAGLLAVIFLSERVSTRQWSGIALATAGAMLIKISG